MLRLAILLPVLLLPIALLSGVAGVPWHPSHAGAVPNQDETSPQDAAQEETDAPGPRRKIAGLRGVRVTSRILYTDPDATPHSLEACYAFPDRVRTRLAPEGGRVTARRLTYRFGTRFWAVDPGAFKSHELKGSDQRSAQLELELRRAVFLWPDGFEWTSVEGGQEASLGPLGRLRATFAEDEPEAEAEAESRRPVAVAVLDALDTERQSLTDLTWTLAGERPWPEHLVLRYAGEMVWAEEVLEVDTVTRFVDAWFRPPDQRRNSKTASRKSPRAFDLPSRTVRRIELPADITPADALARADELLLDLRPRLAERGLQLDASPYLELDAQGHPRSVLLILLRPPETLPDGWTREQERAAWGLFLGGIQEFAISDLHLLRKASGEDLPQAGVPFLRIRPAGSDPRRAELVLPLGG